MKPNQLQSMIKLNSNMITMLETHIKETKIYLRNGRELLTELTEDDDFEEGEEDFARANLKTASKFLRYYKDRLRKQVAVQVAMKRDLQLAQDIRSLMKF